jgi:hypothetical protein
MEKRWVAAGMSETERSFRKVKGGAEMPSWPMPFAANRRGHRYDYDGEAR